MTIFISGGCKNGKSTKAQDLAFYQRKQGAGLYYVATMQPSDGEDEARIKRHIEERAGMGFKTLEIPVGIPSLLNLAEKGDSLLLDSTTALLANEMFSHTVDDTAPARVCSDLQAVLSHFEHIVVVSDYIYSGTEQYDLYTESYRKGLSTVDRLCAKLSDIVLEACAGNFIIHKGAGAYETIV